MKPFQSDFDCTTLSQSVFGLFQGAAIPIVPGFCMCIVFATLIVAFRGLLFRDAKIDRFQTDRRFVY